MLATSSGAGVYAVLFSFSILLTYVTVRRGWLHLPAATISGVIYTSVSFFLFSLAQGNNLLQAVVVGIALGTVFTMFSVIAAAIFRANALESGRETAKKAQLAASFTNEDKALKA